MMTKEMLHPSSKEALLQRKPGYKHTKLGWIPADWGFDFIEKFAIRGSGHTPDKKRPEYYDGGIKWVSLRDSSRLDNYYIRETETQISQAGLSNSSAVMHRKGTVILSRDAGVGKSAILADDMAVSQHFIAWECGPHLDNRFLYYLLQQQKPLFERMAIGSTIKTIGLPFFKKFRIPLPPLPEQQRIATLLTTWDRAITTTQALIKQLEARKRGLMQRLLTGEVRLPGFSSASAPGGEGEWKEYRAGKIFANISDKDHDGEFEVLSATQEYGVIPRSEVGIDIKYDKASLSSYKKLHIGDFVISLRSFQGGIEYSEYEGLVSPAYTVLREVTPISKQFFKEFFKSQTFINRLNSIIYGIRDGKQISYKEFSSLKFVVPPLEEQRAIGKVANSLEEEIRLSRERLNHLEKQKRGLMQQLLTGQKRLLA